MKNILHILKSNTHTNFLKKETNMLSVSVAISESGKSYIGGKVESYNHILDITSELSALILSSQVNDYKIKEVVTMIHTDKESKLFVDPSVLKLLADHSIRSGNQIRYSVFDINENKIFETNNVSLNIPYYKPDVELLKKVNNSEIEGNMIRLENFKDLREDEIIELLKKYSKIGIGRNYPTSNKASGYGSAIITDKGNLYFAGQYSTPDHRYGVHSEPAVFISALSNNDKNIVYLGVSSTKHQDVMCEMCGCCRQFYAEIIERTKQDIKFFTFSFDGKSVNHYDGINEYLKNTWSSKNNS